MVYHGGIALAWLGQRFARYRPHHFQLVVGLGWDKQYGGIINFRDCRNLLSRIIRDMKFWWPQCEAIIASLYAYLATGDDEYMYRHQKISEWTYAHFPDSEFGEWYGYLHRDGTVAQPAKESIQRSVPRAKNDDQVLYPVSETFSR